MDNLTPEQIAERARWDALTPAQKGIETKARKAAEKARKAAGKAPEPKATETPAPAVEDQKIETPAPAVEDQKIETPAPAVETPEKPKAKDGFLNPFTAGVTYEDFVKAIPNGNTVGEYCKGKLTEDEINWISEEVENFKKNKKK